MTIGQPSDVFIQAEIDYRRERVSAMFDPRPHARTHRHLPWPLSRSTFGQRGPRGHRHPAVS